MGETMIKCIQDFRQGEYEFFAGNYVVVKPTVESWLLDSFPAFFVNESIEVRAEVATAPVEVATVDVQKPPADKAIKQPRGRK